MLCSNLRKAIRQKAEEYGVTTKMILESFKDLRDNHAPSTIEVVESSPVMRALDAAQRVAYEFRGQSWTI